MKHNHASQRFLISLPNTFSSWDFGILIPAGSLAQRQRRHQGFRYILSATVLLALMKSVTGVRYIDRECALNRQVSRACLWAA